MADEVKKIELYGVNDAGDVRGWDCASGTKIPKGSVLKFSTARLAAISDGLADIYAGVASADKAGDDNTTRVGTWQNGILEFTASATVTAGDKVVTSEVENWVATATAEQAASTQHVIIGYALNTATVGTRVQVRVDN